MSKSDKSLVLQKKIFEHVVPFEKLPAGIKQNTFEFIEFRRELSKETDRGCALLAAAHLDDMLEKLLRKKLLGNKKHLELIFGFNGPLGTFSSRVLLCYSMGLISSNDLHDIQIIRKIRNEFGHSFSIINFETEKIKALCDNLKRNVHPDSYKSRYKFLNVVSGLSGLLFSSIKLAEQFKEEPNLDLEKRKEEFNKLMAIFNEAMADFNTNELK